MNASWLKNVIPPVWMFLIVVRIVTLKFPLLFPPSSKGVCEPTPRARCGVTRRTHIRYFRLKYYFSSLLKNSNAVSPLWARVCASVCLPCSPQPVGYAVFLRLGGPEWDVPETYRFRQDGPLRFFFFFFKALLCYVLLMPLRWFGLTFADALGFQQISCQHKNCLSRVHLLNI